MCAIFPGRTSHGYLHLGRHCAVHGCMHACIRTCSCRGYKYCILSNTQIERIHTNPPPTDLVQLVQVQGRHPLFNHHVSLMMGARSTLFQNKATRDTTDYHDNHPSDAKSNWWGCKELHQKRATLDLYRGKYTKLRCRLFVRYTLVLHFVTL